MSWFEKMMDFAGWVIAALLSIGGLYAVWELLVVARFERGP